MLEAQVGSAGLFHWGGFALVRLIYGPSEQLKGYLHNAQVGFPIFFLQMQFPPFKGIVVEGDSTVFKIVRRGV